MTKTVHCVFGYHSGQEFTLLENLELNVIILSLSYIKIVRFSFLMQLVINFIHYYVILTIYRLNYYTLTIDGTFLSCVPVNFTSYDNQISLVLIYIRFLLFSYLMCLFILLSVLLKKKRSLLYSRFFEIIPYFILNQFKLRWYFQNSKIN